MSDIDERFILDALEPVATAELNRHLRVSTNWQPHEYIPWEQGRNFGHLGGEPWEPGQSALSEAAQAALHLNLLTEDNLPSYHREIATRFGRDSAWGQWVGRWTAEEARHGTALRDYLVVTRAIDPVRLEVDRLAHMTLGYDSGDKTPLQTLAYVALQELATRVSHRNTGRQAKADGDHLADTLLARIAKDENLHMVFYRNLGSAALAVAPNAMMRAITDEVRRFSMPGKDSIPGFTRLSQQIAQAGIYDLPLFLDQVVEPTLAFWDINSREDLTGDGTQARDELYASLGGLRKIANRFIERRAKARVAAGLPEQPSLG